MLYINIVILCKCFWSWIAFQRGQRPLDPEEVTNEALRSMCDNTLHLFTTTVGRLTDVSVSDKNAHTDIRTEGQERL